MKEQACSKHVVLIGVGHTNAHIVRMWGMNPIPDADLTCISDHSVATYSGMLPAVLAGQHPTTAMEIDLVQLCNSVGARLVTNAVERIDHDQRLIHFTDRPAIPFDALSIGIGSVPTTANVDIADESCLKIKPMQSFLDRLQSTLKMVQANHTPGAVLKVAVVGSGVAGIEILFCLAPFLEKHTSGNFEIQLVTRSDRVLPAAGDSLRSKVAKEISRRGHKMTLGACVKKVDSRGLHLEAGAFIEADLVIWATGASAPPALGQFGLELDQRGFIAVDRTLQSPTNPGCFAVGDTGTIVSEDLPKAGVYAVRQGPVLWNNIHNYLNGKALREYRPQRSFLKLVNTGDGSAIGEWKGMAFAGRWVMNLKDSIDGRFMRMYQSGLAMQDDSPMQCRGCGCKLPADVLESALNAKAGDIDQPKRDDAAILFPSAVGGNAQSTILASTDFFSSPFPDAFLTGRVAAIHSASDIVATGGQPTHALANVVVAEGDPATQQRWVQDFLAGAGLEFDKYDAAVVGGHTIVGPRTEVGFTVIGTTNGAPITKEGLQPGDHLLITKPLGTGVLMAAHMRSKCKAAHYQALIESMLAEQIGYIAIARKHGVTSMTDVTGFGLAGHLVEMLQASSVSAQIDLSTVPLLPGVATHIESEIESSLLPANLKQQRWTDREPTIAPHDPRFRALFDPQTCGGLLFGIPAGHSADFIDACQASNLVAPCPVGVVTEAVPGGASVRVKIIDSKT